MLRLQPEDYLIALGFLGESSLASLTLTNPTPSSVAYKVKANHPTGVQFTNHKGTLEGGGSVEVLISLDSDWTDAKDCKLQIVAAPFRDLQQADWSRGCPQMMRVVRVFSLQQESPALLRLNKMDSLVETRRLTADLLLRASVLKQRVEVLRRELVEAKSTVPRRETARSERWLGPGLCAFLLGLSFPFLIPLKWTGAP